VDGVDLTCHGGEVLGLLAPNAAPARRRRSAMLYGFLNAERRRHDPLRGRRRHARARSRFSSVQLQACDTQRTRSTATSPCARTSRSRPAISGHGPTTCAGRRRRAARDAFALHDVCRRQARGALGRHFRRRLMIARALVHRPRLLFLPDEAWTTGWIRSAASPVVGSRQRASRRRARDRSSRRTIWTRPTADDVLTVLAQGKSWRTARRSR
jgi:hypothetical protein